MNILTILLILSSTLWAGSLTDSLLTLLETTKGKERISLLLDLSFQTKENNPNQSILYAEEAYELAHLWNENRLEAEAQNALGNAHFFSGLYTNAIFHYREVEQIWTSLNHSPGLIAIYNNLGMVYSRIGSYQKAIEYNLKAIDIQKLAGDTLQLAISYLSLGNTSIRIEEYSKAKEYYLRAQDLFRDLNDLQGENYIINNLGVINMLEGNYKLAEENFIKYYEYARKNNLKRALSSVYTNRGELHYRQEHYEKALTFYKQAFEIKYSLGDSSQIASINHDLSGVMLGLKKYNSALEYELTSKQINESLNVENSLLENFDRLSKIYIKLNNTHEAYINLEKYAVLKDKINKDTEKEKLTQMRIQMDVSEMERENQIQSLELEKHRQKQFLMIVIIILGSVLFIGLVYRYIYVKKTTTALQKERDKLHLAELHKTQQEVEHTKKELLTKAMYMARNREQLLGLAGNLKSSEPNSKTKRQLFDFINNEAEWKDFENWFTEVHTDFFATLAEKFPDLTPTERKLCAFLKLNLNTKEIASLMHLSAKTIEVYRTNLRKKLGLKPKENLNIFFDRLN